MKTGSKQRNTKQRRVILDELRQLKSHPTAAELYEIVRKQLPRISLGTVYRNLELLAENSTIHKLDMSSTEARFDGETRPHHHARCTKCGTVDDLFDLPENLLQGEKLTHNNYDLHGYRIEFYGICHRCIS